ncbi:hypothetical protein DPMN_030142 [Dreissena polymorpha]|uniref:Uncharacterized protein n=1 Tax=Dreissena polymorpha TaxID=45954 RepID=A0A9D4RHS5_DREPO|nr:hypothetical protein DPMN_030142 [Dreissena polymorpha]
MLLQHIANCNIYCKEIFKRFHPLKQNKKQDEASAKITYNGNTSGRACRTVDEVKGMRISTSMFERYIILSFVKV